MAQATMLDRQALEQALDDVGRRANAEDKTIAIAIYGGSALMLTYGWRIATVDVVRSSKQTGSPSGGWRGR
jgi:hypothetical protein